MITASFINALRYKMLSLKEQSFSSSPNICMLESSRLLNLYFRFPWPCGRFQHKESTLLIQRKRDLLSFNWGFTAFCDMFDVPLVSGIVYRVNLEYLRRDVFIIEGCERSILHTD